MDFCRCQTPTHARCFEWKRLSAMHLLLDVSCQCHNATALLRHRTQLNKFFFTGNVAFRFQVISWHVTDTMITCQHWSSCHQIRSSTHSQGTSHIGFSNWMFLANATMPLHYWGTSTALFHRKCRLQFWSFHDMSLSPWSLVLVNTDHVIRSSTQSQCTSHSHIGFIKSFAAIKSSAASNFSKTISNQDKSERPHISLFRFQQIVWLGARHTKPLCTNAPGINDGCNGCKWLFSYHQVLIQLLSMT